MFVNTHSTQVCSSHQQRTNESIGRSRYQSYVAGNNPKRSKWRHTGLYCGLQCEKSICSVQPEHKGSNKHHHQRTEIIHRVLHQSGRIHQGWVVAQGSLLLRANITVRYIVYHYHKCNYMYLSYIYIPPLMHNSIKSDRFFNIINFFWLALLFLEVSSSTRIR